LYLSLIASVVFLLITNFIIWKSEQPAAKVLGTSFVFALVSLGLCMVMLPPVLLQAILLGMIVSVWGLRRWRPSVFLKLSCTATLLVYGVLSVLAWQETVRMQREFSFISIDDRLPLMPSAHPAVVLTPATADELASFETLLEEKKEWPGQFRSSSLRRLHEETLSAFVNQPGFGVTRMMSTRYALRLGMRNEPPLAQPGKPFPSPWPADSFSNAPPPSQRDGEMRSLHQESMVDFVNLAGFGYIKDRQHVAGFQEHQISQVPVPRDRWTLQTLDLVGLAVHEKPLVYVSDHLPRMDELRTAPTRTLDEFEAAGLPTLERGEDLYVRDRGSERRMLGAIRSTRQCLACHGGERGDLLGAFSYRLTRGVTAAR
jgi:hypothetical protein